MSLPAGGMAELELAFSCHQPAATLADVTRCCKYSQMLLMMDENLSRNMYS
jgi:hypothetical protein